jgi:hypothetical protein
MKIKTIAITTSLFLFSLASFRMGAQSVTPPFAHLTKLTDREYVDLSKVSFIRLPITVQSTTGGPTNRIGEEMVVDGSDVDFTPEAETMLRQLLQH